MNDTPETAALRSRIADLEQQLRLADQGNARLAAQCLALDQQLQSHLAVNPVRETHACSALLLPKLFYDIGMGLSEQDCLAAPAGVYDPRTHQVTAAFELPETASLLRLDPGELPCCISGLTLSDERLTVRPVNALPLQKEQLLFLRADPNLFLEGLTEYPAGFQLVVTYQYYPLEDLSGDPLFDAVVAGLVQMQKQQAESARDAAALHAQLAAQQQQIAALEAKREEYETALEQVLSSSSWKLTAPLRALRGR
ncbi:MAG: hypothetical protein ACI4JC_00105 [Faecalibacterium sp.]